MMEVDLACSRVPAISERSNESVATRAITLPGMTSRPWTPGRVGAALAFLGSLDFLQPHQVATLPLSDLPEGAQDTQLAHDRLPR